MRLLQKIYDTLHGGADGPPELTPRDPDGPPPTPVRTRMATPADVAMILDARARRTGHGGGWRQSLTDLLSLMDLPDTGTQREALAGELNIATDGLDAAEAEAALHAALLQRLADNDAVAPQDFFK
jgi:hypothetical protein